MRYTNTAIVLLTGLKYRIYRNTAKIINAISQNIDSIYPQADAVRMWKQFIKNMDKPAEYSYTTMGIKRMHTTTLQIFFLTVSFSQKHFFVAIGNNTQ